MQVMESRLRVIEELAGLYPQLYLAPGAEGQRLWPDVVGHGKPVPAKDLSHFHGSPQDECCVVETPAGAVRAVTLGEREDFVTFVRIMGKACAEAEVPSSMGALFLDGVVNREIAFMPKKEGLIILSTGPYSGVPAEEAGLSEEAWNARSHTIRLYHECTHFVCYRTSPRERCAVRDELVADAVGLVAAFGRFDRGLAERFLGITNGRYTGGRLENYTDDPERQLPKINDIFAGIEETTAREPKKQPLELAILLDELYG